MIITSYALVRRDEEFFSQRKFHYVILDEAQHIKNPTSATARAVKKLQSEHRLALTGTPIENRLSEIWSIFDFVSPGLLGDLNRFEEKFARPIDRGDKNAAEKLRAAIHRFVLRRDKMEVAKDLPQKIEQDIICRWRTSRPSSTRRSCARCARGDGRGREAGPGQGQDPDPRGAHAPAPGGVRSAPAGARGRVERGHQGKLGALREIIQEAVAGGHRVLIFSQFVEMLHLIRDVLEEEGIKYE